MTGKPKKTSRSSYFKYLLPTKSVGKTYELGRNEYRRHKETFQYIGTLYAQAKGVLAPKTGQSFEYVVKQQGIIAVRRIFLFQKRLSIAAGFVFLFIGTTALVNGNLNGIATIISACLLFYALALSAQVRLWQVSRELYKTTFTALISGREFWWIEPLNPEISYERNS